MANQRARITQRLVNSFPDWSDTRRDIQSVGFQFFNAIGVAFEDVFKQLQDTTENFHLSTTYPNDLGLHYRVNLPGDFEFAKQDEDDMESNYLPPTVSGMVGTQFFEVSLADDNSVFNFWKEAVPSRISILEDYTAGHINTVNTLFSGFASTSPLQPLANSGLVGIPNKLHVTVSGGTTYLSLNTMNEVRRGTVQLIGETQSGTELTEEHGLIYDEKWQTTNKFYSVSGLYIYNADPSDDVDVRVTMFDFQNPPYKTNYYIDYDEDTGLDIPSFWAIGSGSPGAATLDFVVYDHPELEMKVDGFVGTHAKISQELVDSDEIAIDATDLAVEPHSDRIWVTTHHKLYCYSADLPYINLQTLAGKDADPVCRIETDSDFVISGEVLTLELFWRNPSKGIDRHRVFIEHENGNRWGLLEDGTMEAYNSATDYYVYGEPRTRYLRQPVELTLSTAGTYTFILETYFEDGTKETDKRCVVYSPKLLPVGEYDLETLGLSNLVTGIDFDSDNFIWLRDQTGAVHKIGRFYDTMLIDYEKKILFLRDEYDSVTVWREE